VQFHGRYTRYLQTVEVTSPRQEKEGSLMEIPKLQLALDTFDLAFGSQTAAES
jgi:hypothetical protein